MTVVELLIPRIKCIEPFLGMEYQGWELNMILDVPPIDDYQFILSLTKKYPLNFKLLEWWEERTVDMMPKYLKTTYDGGINEVHRYDFETNTIYVIYPEGKCQYSLNAYLSARVPATEQEYKDFINLK